MEFGVAVIKLLSTWGSNCSSRASQARLLSCNYCLSCFVIWLLLPQTPRICILQNKCNINSFYFIKWKNECIWWYISGIFVYMYFGFGFFFFILEGSTCYVRTFFLGKPLSDAPPMERYLKVLKFPYAMLLSWEIWPCRAHCTLRLMIIKISTYAKWEYGWSKINEIFRNAFNDLKSLNFNKVPQKM